jgi:transposase
MSSLNRDVIAMLEAGKSCRSIAKALNISAMSVSRLRHSLNIKVQTSLGGRPSKLTARDRRQLVRLVTSAKADNAIQLKKLSGLDVTPQTIRNALKKEGMKSCVKAKKPLLKRSHIKARLDFARKYQHWTEADWHRVIWSDETKINRFGSDGRIWVWKKAQEKLSKRLIKPTVKFGGGSLMIWGCMTAHGVGYMCRIDGRMDGELYRSILDDYLHETVDYYHMDHDNFIFQQDNDPKHKAKLTMKWFKDNNVEVLDWPAQSPDLNPIEHLWDHLERQLNAYETVPTSMDELWKRVEVE